MKGSAEPCHNRHMRIFDMDVCVCVSKNVRPSCVKSSNEKSGATHITHCLLLQVNVNYYVSVSHHMQSVIHHPPSNFISLSHTLSAGAASWVTLLIAREACSCGGSLCFCWLYRIMHLGNHLPLPPILSLCTVSPFLSSTTMLKSNNINNISNSIVNTICTTMNSHNTTTLI